MPETFQEGFNLGLWVVVFSVTAYFFILTTARALFALYFAAKLDHHKAVIRELKPSPEERARRSS